MAAVQSRNCEWNGEPMAPIIATDDAHVYWSYDTRIIRVRKGSRERTEIELGEGRKAGLVVDTDFLYVTNRDCTAFVVVEKSSLTVNVVPIPNGGQDLGGATATAIDRDDVFCSHGQFIHAISKKDRTVRDLVRDTDASDRFASTASDGEMLFWINRPNILGTDTESLRGRSKAGSSLETLAVLGRNAGLLRFDAERGWLYTIANNPGGVPLLGYSLATNELQELATNQLGGGGITFDSKYIYWTIDPLEPAGSIMRMTAPEGG